MQIYFMKHISNKWDSNHDTLLSFLSEQRQEKVLRYKFDDDKILSLYAALLTRMAIMEKTNLKNHSLSFICQSNHKPYLKDSHIDFSFSHTRQAVLCGIADNEKIGVDVEPLKDTPFDLMNLVFHPAEISYIQKSNGSQKGNRFFEIWTKKEAYTKYLGTGLATDLVSINTLEAPVCNKLFTWIDENYVCSVCCDTLETFSPIVITEEDIFSYFIHSAVHSSKQE